MEDSMKIQNNKAVGVLTMFVATPVATAVGMMNANKLGKHICILLCCP